MDFGGGIEPVFEYGEASKDLSRLDEKGAHLLEDAGHAIGSSGVESFGRTNFAHTDNHHFSEATLDGPREAGVEFDSVEDEDTS